LAISLSYITPHPHRLPHISGAATRFFPRYRSNARLIFPSPPSLIGTGMTHIPPMKPGWEGAPVLVPYHFIIGR
jgi:hypothetical protein